MKGDAGKQSRQGPAEGHFSTQIAGMKPAYIEELKARFEPVSELHGMVSEAQKPKKAAVDASKPTLDESGAP